MNTIKNLLEKNIGPIAALVVLTVWGAAWIFCDSSEGIFAIINTLFSGLAFAGVVWTILMQKDELKAQRNELELTREVFKEQSKTSKKQRFENSFYQLIAVHNEKVRAFSVVNGESGAKAFARIYGELKGASVEAIIPVSEQMLSRYLELKKAHSYLEYSPYASNLFNIISFD